MGERCSGKCQEHGKTGVICCNPMHKTDVHESHMGNSYTHELAWTMDEFAVCRLISAGEK
jgi:hypothetical protein